MEADVRSSPALPRSPALARPWRDVACIAAVAALLFTLRLLAPPNLLDQDQENPAAYVLDAVKNSHWICQRDFAGDITSKPPLFTWLAALATIACGRISLFSLYLPGALALFGQGWLVHHFGREHFGGRAAIFGALACMLCTAGLKQFGLARTDGVFAFTITTAALIAYRSWCRGRGWTWFWVAAAAATLTKGPLGLLLASFGLFASFWEGRSGDSLPIRGSHLFGIVLFLGLTVGWLALAYWQLGQPLLDKLILKELLFHAVSGEQKKMPGSLFYLSPLYYLGRCAPWSLFAFAGLWRVWRYPAVNPAERRFERFAFCWFCGGLFLFSMSPHQRGDLLWPIIPAGALVAGRELARLARRLSDRQITAVWAAAVSLAVVGFSAYYFGPHARHPLVRQTVALRTLAQDFERQGGRNFPLSHVDDPAAFQIYLDTFNPPISFERAAELLRSPVPSYVAVNGLEKLRAARRPSDPPVYSLFEDAGPVSKLKVRIVSNRPALLPARTQ